MPGRPNILMITSDQQRADCYGFEGRRVKTPHLDHLAHQGTRFSACITPNVVCQPSRASMLTGLLPRTHGVWDNGVDLDETVGAAGFAGQFAKAGYRTGFIGKAHFSTFHTFQPSGRPENRGSTHLYAAGWSGPYMGFEQVELMVGGHNMHLPQKPGGPLMVLSGIVVADLVMGTFMESGALTILTIPIYFPIAKAIGLDPVQFGVMIAVNQEMAQIHPPAGLNLVTVSSISGIPLTRMMLSVLPFIAIELVMVYLLYFFPQLTLFLPSHMGFH